MLQMTTPISQAWRGSAPRIRGAAIVAYVMRQPAAIPSLAYVTRLQTRRLSAHSTRPFPVHSNTPPRLLSFDSIASYKLASGHRNGRALPRQDPSPISASASSQPSITSPAYLVLQSSVYPSHHRPQPHRTTHIPPPVTHHAE